MILSTLRATVAQLRELVGSLDTEALSGDGAAGAVELFSEAERLATAGRTLVARRVVESRAWRSDGATSAVSWLAAQSGSTFARAAATLNTAMRIDDLPETRTAMLSGKLSESQVLEIAAAAAADPAAEESLLQLAGQQNLAALRERCRDVRAAAAGDEDARERIRRGRFFKHWTDRDGALRFDARVAPDDGAPLLAVIRARADQLRADAFRGGEVEPAEAYAADALCSLADGPASPKAVLHVHVSASALERGHTIAGETCRIDGIGPITVGAARRLATAGMVTVIEHAGADVRRVANLGRTIPANLRAALEARDPTCVVPECNRRRALEIDHIVPFGQGGETKLANLARLCKWHHAQKTHHGARLSGRPGAWVWTPGREARGAGARARGG